MLRSHEPEESEAASARARLCSAPLAAVRNVRKLPMGADIYCKEGLSGGTAHHRSYVTVRWMLGCSSRFSCSLLRLRFPNVRSLRTLD